MKRILYVFILLISLPELNAQVSAPKYSNEFLSIGVGGRALAMGNTQVSFVNDVTAAYWNPAGLAYSENDLEISGMHSEYFAGIAKYDYAGISKKLTDSSAVAFSFIRFGVDDIPNTTQLIDNQGNVNYDRISYFSAADYAFYFSYSRKLKIEGLSVGGNAKFIYRQIGDFASAFGFGLDAGLQYKKKEWLLGFMAKDVTSTFNSWSVTIDEETKEVFESTGNELPESNLELTLPKFVLGVGRNFKVAKDINLLASMDIDITTDKRRSVLIGGELLSLDPHFGLEANYDNIVYLRGGINNIQRYEVVEGEMETRFQPNLGLGLRIRKLFVDYAITSFGESSAAPYSNVFSLRLEL